MAEVITSVAATLKQSIARVELFTDAHLAQDDWELKAHFEDALYDDNGLIPGQRQNFGTREVRRRFGDVKTQEITAAGVTCTIAQLAALIQAGIYAFRAEDIAAE